MVFCARYLPGGGDLSGAGIGAWERDVRRIVMKGRVKAWIVLFWHFAV